MLQMKEVLLCVDIVGEIIPDYILLVFDAETFPKTVEKNPHYLT